MKGNQGRNIGSKENIYVRQKPLVDLMMEGFGVSDYLFSLRS